MIYAEEDYYYHQMSAEIELLVNDTDCTRRQSNEELPLGETMGTGKITLFVMLMYFYGGFLGTTGPLTSLHYGQYYRAKL